MLKKNHIRNLFAGSDFQIQKSQNDLGVQLADMMAGTLGYIFDELKKSNKSSDFEELIKDKLISLNQFPKEYKPEKFNERETFSEYDTTIATLGLNRVFDL